MSDIFSRRNVLLGLGGTAAAGTVAAQSGGAEFFEQLLRPTNGGRRGVALATAGYDDWAAHVGTFFTAHTGHVLELSDVQRFRTVGERPAALRDSAFVARFDSVSGGALKGSAIYRVNHPDGGTFDVFLTSGPPDKPLRLLAVFN